tara:strand:+ start:177 stop:806 length:630 start_codon:yes stop_codon:yes gene_type:complete
MKFDIYHKSGKKSSKKITLNDDVFGIEPNQHCIYLAINSEMAAMRQGTHSSKTKSEVSGSGAKPWRQKGTGRARVGSIRNPSRVHGAKALGPKPHKYEKKVNKKVKRLARRSILSQKASEKKLMILDNLILDSSKTKEFVLILENLKVLDKKITILSSSIDDNLYFSSRNLHNVFVVPTESASAYDLIDCQLIIIDESSIEILNNKLSN